MDENINETIGKPLENETYKNMDSSLEAPENNPANTIFLASELLISDLQNCKKKKCVILSNQAWIIIK